MAAIYPLPKTEETATGKALGRSFGTGSTFPRIRRQGLCPHLIKSDFDILADGFDCLHIRL